MRKLGVLMIAAAGVFAFSGVARAADVRTLTVSETSVKAGASTGLSIGLITNSQPPGTTPNSGAHDDIFLHKGLSYNGANVAKCDKARLLVSGPKVCSRSKIGTGNIKALVHTCGENPPVEQALAQEVDLQLFNGTAGKKLYAYLKSPIIGSGVIDISVLKASGLFGLKFVFAVPDTLVSPLPGLCVSLVDVRLTIDKKTVTSKRRVRGHTVTTRKGLLVNGPCPSNKKWRYRDNVKFVSAPHTPSGTGRGETTIRCRR